MERRRMNAVAQLRRPAARVSDPSSLVPSLPFPKTATEALAVEFCRFLDQADAVPRSDQLFDLLSISSGVDLPAAEQRLAAVARADLQKEWHPPHCRRYSGGLRANGRFF